MYSNRAREERALAAEKRLSALTQKQTTKGKLHANFTCATTRGLQFVPIGQPSDGDTSSDSDAEFIKTEGDDDRRKILFDSIQTGDSALDQLRHQSKLKDYTGFFHLPDGSHEGDKTTPRDSRDSAGTPPTASDEIIDLSLSTDEEGGDDHPANVTTTTSSGAGVGCDIQRSVTSTSVTCSPHGASNGKWTCLVCTL